MNLDAHHTILLVCIFAMLAGSEAAEQNAQAGRIIGHIDGVAVDDVGAPTVLIGAYRFPNDGDLAALDAAAKASYVKSVFSIEPIMFGKWRD
jgi:hypothetical protein